MLARRLYTDFEYFLNWSGHFIIHGPRFWCPPDLKFCGCGFVYNFCETFEKYISIIAYVTISKVQKQSTALWLFHSRKSYLI